MKNAIKAILLIFVLTIMASTYAAAVNIEIESVEINGKTIQAASGATRNYAFDRGEELDIDVCIYATGDVEDTQIEADIYGYRYSTREEEKVSDTSATFDLTQNDTECKSLSLEVPTKMDKDYFKLRIRAADRDGIEKTKEYRIHVTGVARESAVEIRDFTITPDEVIAGRAFSTLVRVRNIGDDDLEDLKATVSVPRLNIETSEYMDELDADESDRFEELLLRVPECAKPGDYEVEIVVEFDEYEQVTETGTIRVIASESCPDNNGGAQPPAENGKTTITVPTSQEVSQGASVVYPIMIANSASTAKTYVLSVSGASGWATSRLEPTSVVVVPAGQSKTVSLYVSANPNAELGDKAFTLTVESGAESRQIPLTARVTQAAGTNWNSVKRGLEIGLIVLVIILIIIALVIGFNKLKENKQEPETYY